MDGKGIRAAHRSRRAPRRAKSGTPGFTLIELMIVIAIIALVAAIAVPKYISARISANEASAIATLRSLLSSQTMIMSQSAIDSDSDGSGEYASFGELSGSQPLRIDIGGAPGAGLVGLDELDPALISSAFGTVINSRVARSGYLFQIFLPTATVAGATPGIAEDPAGGFTGAAFPDPDNAERMWCAYAWPLEGGSSGSRAFFVNEEGDILASLNRGPAVYNFVAAPNFDAAYSVAGDMDSPRGLNGVPAVDGNLWVIVQ